MRAVKKAELGRYPKYKYSGLEWIGEIPKEWDVWKINHLYPFVGSGTTPTAGSELYYGNGEYPFLQTGDLTDGLIKNVSKKISERAVNDYSTLKLYPKESLVIAMYGATIGKLGILKIDSYTNQACCVFGYSSKIISKYFFYALLGFRQRIISLSYGGGQPNISQDLIKSLKFPIPPLPEQTAIANFLDDNTTKIDEAISQKEKLIALLKERKQILIQQAVTKGLPSEERKKAGLNPIVKLKDSGIDWIGQIPEHWEVVANRILFKERKDPGREGLPLLSVSIHTAVSSEELNEEDNIQGRIKIEDKSNYKYVDVHDVVFNMMRAWQGAIGAVSVEGMVSPAYVVAQPKERLFSPFFEYLYRTTSFIQQMSRNSKGITDFRKRLYWDEFKQLITVLPPHVEQEKIVQFIESESLKIDESISLQKNQIEKLKEYKATLIDSAVTGKIKVS